MFDFADPGFLLLLPMPVLAWYFLRNGAAAGSALVVPEGIGTRFGLGGAAARAGWRDRLVPLLLWISLVIALAGPRLLVPNPALPVSGRDLVLALDLSGSMIREDFHLDGREVSRLTALKHAAADFVARRGGDRVALVIFGSRAYYATPPTHDVTAVAHAIEQAEIGISGRATGISEGLGLALKRLRESSTRSKVVILLSDGVHNSGPVKPRDAARLAGELGITIHTIAMGPRDLRTADGERDAVDAETLKAIADLSDGVHNSGPVKPRDAARLAGELGITIHTIAMGPRDLRTADGERDAVDAETLKAIADLSGGQYFRAKTTEDLVAVTEAIDRLETTAGDGPAALAFRPLWTWPAGFAVLCCLGLIIGPLRT